MTQLWYEIKKFGRMEIRKDCKLCAASLKNFRSRPLTKDEAIIILPDVNCSGIIMGYHIGRTTREKIERTTIAQDIIEEEKNENND